MSNAHRNSFVLIAVMALLAASCSEKSAPKPDKNPQGESTKETPKEPLAEAQDLIAAGKAVMIDVRSQGERDAGHLEGSIYLPITEIQEKAGQDGFAQCRLPSGDLPGEWPADEGATLRTLV